MLNVLFYTITHGGALNEGGRYRPYLHTYDQKLHVTCTSEIGIGFDLELFIDKVYLSCLRQVG